MLCKRRTHASLASGLNCKPAPSSARADWRLRVTACGRRDASLRCAEYCGLAECRVVSRIPEWMCPPRPRNSATGRASGGSRPDWRFRDGADPLPRDSSPRSRLLHHLPVQARSPRNNAASLRSKAATGHDWDLARRVSQDEVVRNRLQCLEPAAVCRECRRDPRRHLVLHLRVARRQPGRPHPCFLLVHCRSVSRRQV